MFAERLVGFKCFCDKGTHLANTTLEMCTYERDEFIAWIGIHPDAILNVNKPGTPQETSELIAYASTPFADIKNKHSPFPIPKCRLRYHVFPEFYSFYHLQSFFCKTNSTFPIFAGYGYETGLF